MSPLILLFGLPRSGTTWLGKIFDSHPSTLYRHEPDSRGVLNQIALLPEPAEMPLHGHIADRFVAGLHCITGVKVAASVPVFRKEYLSHAQFWAKRASVPLVRLVSRAVSGIPVPEFVDQDRIRNAPLVWKSVESTGRFGLFASRFAYARGFLILRHPCGHLASLFRSVRLGKASPRNNSFRDFGIFERIAGTTTARKYGLCTEDFHAMTPAERLTWRWVIVNEHAINAITPLSNCTIVRYEDVCYDPLARSEELFSFAKLEWNPQTEQFISASTSCDSGKYYSVFKDPVRAANAWRSELSTDVIRQISAVIARSPLVRYYPVDA
jgi:hypothetical protein